MFVFFCFLLGYALCPFELLYKTWPLGSKNISACERAIAAADNKGIDAFADQVLYCLESSFSGSKLFASCCADRRAALRIQLLENTKFRKNNRLLTM